MSMEDLLQEQQAVLDIKEMMPDLVAAMADTTYMGRGHSIQYTTSQLCHFLWAEMREQGYEWEDRHPRQPNGSRKKISKILRTMVYELDGYACVVCGIRKTLTLDHIVAVANGGKDIFDNLQTMCQRHNSKKGCK